MPKTPETPDQIDDTDLDAATGAGHDHKRWSDLQSFSQPIHRARSELAIEELTIAHEGIKRRP